MSNTSKLYLIERLLTNIIIILKKWTESSLPACGKLIQIFPLSFKYDQYDKLDKSE